VRSKLLVTFDSLRWDTFCAASLPFLKTVGDWRRAVSPASYTLPAHMSFFVGKLPQTLDGADLYDSVALRVVDGRRRRSADLWRLANPEAPRDARVTLEGRNVVDGFARAGLRTIGTGAMNWFNTALEPSRVLTEPFVRFAFFDGPGHASHRSSEKQAAWILDELRVAGGAPAFVFWNIGETHASFEYEGCAWQGERTPYGDRELCLERQRACLEHVDGIVGAVAQEMERLAGPTDLILMGDHGEAFGEDGLWGHGFSHPVVMEVPMLIRLAEG